MAITIRRKTWTPEVTDPNERLTSLLEEGVAALNLNVRIVNMLEDAGIITVSQLLKCTPAQLLDVPRFGAKALVAVYRALAQCSGRACAGSN
jgi:DNA-directed RNA polymerase alpha subunit